MTTDTGHKLNYSTYLQLPTLLTCQTPLSGGISTSTSTDNAAPAHDELFFIILHQSYELWFKSMLFELERVCSLLSQKDEQAWPEAIWLLNRVVAIQQLLNQQLTVLETMSPKDFLQFREVLAKASGFQSLQFRLLESRLGLVFEDEIEQQKILQSLSASDQNQFIQTTQQPNLFSCLDQSLSLFANKYWDLSAFTVELRQQWVECDAKYQQHALFDPKHYHTVFDSSARRPTYTCCHAILLIMHYADHPQMTHAYQLLRKCLQIDEQLMKWRHGHGQIVQRMIGGKTGTGGTAGHTYLKQKADKRRIFANMTHLSTFLLPAEHFPPIEHYRLTENSLGAYLYCTQTKQSS